MSSIRSAICLLLVTKTASRVYNKDTLHYLEEFSYLPKQIGAAAMLSSSAVEDALKQLQRYGKIPITGKLDAETKNLMARKRCGLGDQQAHRHRRHKKRYAYGSKWHKNILTYRYHFKQTNFSTE